VHENGTMIEESSAKTLLLRGRSLDGGEDAARADGIIALTIMMFFIFCVAWYVQSRGFGGNMP
jgi:hypothetical protein